MSRAALGCSWRWRRCPVMALPLVSVIHAYCCPLWRWRLETSFECPLLVYWTVAFVCWTPFFHCFGLLYYCYELSCNTRQVLWGSTQFCFCASFPKRVGFRQNEFVADYTLPMDEVWTGLGPAVIGVICNPKQQQIPAMHLPGTRRLPRRGTPHGRVCLRGFTNVLPYQSSLHSEMEKNKGRIVVSDIPQYPYPLIFFYLHIPSHPPLPPPSLLPPPPPLFILPPSLILLSPPSLLSPLPPPRPPLPPHPPPLLFFLHLLLFLLIRYFTLICMNSRLILVNAILPWHLSYVQWNYLSKHFVSYAGNVKHWFYDCLFLFSVNIIWTHFVGCSKERRGGSCGWCHYSSSASLRFCTT